MNAIRTAGSNNEENENSPKMDSGISKSNLLKSKTPAKFVMKNGETNKCNNKVLKVFNIELELNDEEKPIIATPNTIDYCRKNKGTCCTESEISSIVPQFLKSYKKFLKMFEIIEELLVLFRGPKFSETILEKLTTEEIENKKCKEFTQDNSSKQIDFSPNNESIKSYMRELLNLLSELTFYIKRQSWFYGDLICSICNPFDQEYISFNDNILTMTASYSTCIELFDMKEFEIRLSDIFTNFLRPVVNTYMCVTATTENSFNEEIAIKNINQEKYQSLKNDFEFCQKEFDFNDKKCLDLCSKKLNKFEMNSEIFNSYFDLITVLFPALTEMEISEFYKQIKSTDLEEQISHEVEFFELDKDLVQLNGINLQFQEKGINIFSNHWSKKFIFYNEPNGVSE